MEARVTVSTQRVAPGVVRIQLDDGERNLLRPDVLEALLAALHDARDDAVIVTGRPGVLTAGLDLRWLADADAAGAHRLIAALGRMLVALWTHPAPTVCAATGHAIASGTLLALACDHAVAAEDGTWGLVETRIGLTLPRFAVELARARIDPRALDAVLLGGDRLDAHRAAAIGMATQVVATDDVLPRALALAADLATIDRTAYAGTKARLRQDVADRLLAGLDEDVADVLAPRAPAARHSDGPVGDPPDTRT
jgi:enoyl-CoA hydratase